MDWILSGSGGLSLGSVSGSGSQHPLQFSSASLASSMPHNLHSYNSLGPASTLNSSSGGGRGGTGPNYSSLGALSLSPVDFKDQFRAPDYLSR